MLSESKSRTPAWVEHFGSLLLASGCSAELSELAVRASRDVASVPMSVVASEVGKARFAHISPSCPSFDVACVVQVPVMGVGVPADPGSAHFPKLVLCDSAHCRWFVPRFKLLRSSLGDVVQLLTMLRRRGAPHFCLSERFSPRPIRGSVDVGGMWASERAGLLFQLAGSVETVRSLVAAGVFDVDARIGVHDGASSGGPDVAVMVSGGVWPSAEVVSELVEACASALDEAVVVERVNGVVAACHRLALSGSALRDADPVLVGAWLELAEVLVSVPFELPSEFVSRALLWSGRRGRLVVSEQFVAVQGSLEELVAGCGGTDDERMVVPLPVAADLGLLKSSVGVQVAGGVSRFAEVVVTLLRDAGGRVADVRDVCDVARMMA